MDKWKKLNKKCKGCHLAQYSCSCPMPKESYHWYCLAKMEFECLGNEPMTIEEPTAG